MDQLVAEGSKTTEPLHLAGTYATSFGTQRSMLTKKFMLIYWRSPNYSEQSHWGGRQPLGQRCAAAAQLQLQR